MIIAQPLSFNQEPNNGTANSYPNHDPHDHTTGEYITTGLIVVRRQIIQLKTMLREVLNKLPS